MIVTAILPVGEGLLLATADRPHRLPTFEPPEPYWERLLPQLVTEGIGVRTGMELGFVRRVATTADAQLVEMEVLGAANRSTAGWTAVALEEAEAGPWAGALSAWAAGDEVPTKPRLPWESPGRHQETRRWLDRAIAPRGWTTTGYGAQWTHSRNAVLKFPTTGGDVVVKATAAPFRAEGPITVLVGRHAPDLVPEVVAADPSRQLMATLAFEGADVPPIPDEKYMEALPLLVGIQRQLASRVDELIAAGCRDNRGDVLAQRVSDLLDSPLIETLPAADGRRVRAAADRLVESCTSLSRSPLPSTIVHGDFGTNNVVLLDGDRWMLIDWEWATIGDPFRDLAPWSICMSDEASRAAALSVLLREWAGTASPAALEAHARASAAPACLAQACDNVTTAKCLSGADAAFWYAYARRWLLRSLDALESDRPVG